MFIAVWFCWSRLRCCVPSCSVSLFSFLDRRRQNKRVKQEGPKVKTRGAQTLTFRMGRIYISHRDKRSNICLVLFGLLVAALALCSFLLCFVVFIFGYTTTKQGSKTRRAQSKNKRGPKTYISHKKKHTFRKKTSGRVFVCCCLVCWLRLWCFLPSCSVLLFSLL